MERDERELEARRAFLAKAGKFAAVTPVVITELLSVSKGNYAMAISGSGGHGHPRSHGAHDRHRSFWAKWGNDREGHDHHEKHH
jgi:hypothetical protein